eukprot:2875447-Prymnesium_polylepis.1
MDDGDMEGSEWEDDTKSKLKPTADGKSFQAFDYKITKPEKVDKFWWQELPGLRLQDHEAGEGGQFLVPGGEGVGASRSAGRQT